MNVNNQFQVGDSVVKISNKPFKSGKKTGVIKSFQINHNDPKKILGALFEDDCSIVSIDKLKHKE